MEKSDILKFLREERHESVAKFEKRKESTATTRAEFDKYVSETSYLQGVCHGLEIAIQFLELNDDGDLDGDSPATKFDD